MQPGTNLFRIGKRKSELVFFLFLVVGVFLFIPPVAGVDHFVDDVFDAVTDILLGLAADAIHFGILAGGTRETVRFCERFGKPALVVDGNATDPNAIAEQTAGFLCEHSISVLNVAGPRESQSPGARAYSEAVIKTLLQHLREELWSRN